jgi:hypothetical protein
MHIDNNDVDMSANILCNIIQIAAKSMLKCQGGKTSQIRSQPVWWDSEVQFKKPQKN